MTKNNSMKFTSLQKKIKVTFKDKKLLENVFIHRSYLNEHKDFPLPSNEKLEFLGDSVLSLITSMYLYRHFPDLKEGDYTDIKAAIVRTESLGEAADKLKLGTQLYLSKGEERGGGRNNINLLADCFEALVGGIFIDKSFDHAYNFVLEFLFEHRIATILEKKSYLSPKSILQEIVQSEHKILPQYKTVEENGPEHKKTFKVSVEINGKVFATGKGTSKKMAEEKAAKKALEKLS